jgi:hypothetical protein
MPWSRLSERLRFLLSIFGVTMVGVMFESYFNPHYIAVMTGLMLAVVLTAMRYVRLWEWAGKPTGMFLVRAVPLICVVLVLLRVGAKTLQIPLTPLYPQTWCCAPGGNLDRARILGELGRLPGQHLVVVRYDSNHNPDHEWVYNEADIDSAKVVWAREMDEGRNRELTRYFQDRNVWLLEPDVIPPKLSRYSLSDSP